ncbi:hypothetical protein EXIGLDRAFT_717568 [Exidia glandulosa HHB12029]|uniref:Uncharacterized protein n=1 Tax=Exidia glandulosa HHB12029 TaxID=1314781 RepID=A0A165IAX6_EXIGL|nr:hypothetical protein EXIGLDRAFT_717568 [Exidia glandulosa HHB12029]
MLPTLAFLSALMLSLVLASQSPNCPKITPWISGSYGPNNQTSVSGEFPIIPGQSISVQVVELATCSVPTTNPRLVEFSVMLMDVLSYEQIIPTVFSTAQAVIVTPPNPLPDPDGDEDNEDPSHPEDRRRGVVEDPGDHLMGTVSANFAGASFDVLQEVRDKTGFLWIVVSSA